MTKQVVFVLADAYSLAIPLSGNMSLRSGLRQSVNAKGMLFCTSALAILTSALIVCKNVQVYIVTIYS